MTMTLDEDVNKESTASTPHLIVPSLSSSSAMEQSLRKTLQDLEIRSQVESCVKDLLQDVEVAERLTERVRESCLVQDLMKQGQSQAWALEEERMLRVQQKALNQKLADQLVSELWTVSTKLGEFQQLKAAHAELSEEYDSMVAKLLHAQDEIEELREQRTRLPSAPPPATAAATAVPPATMPVAKLEQPKLATVDEKDGEKTFPLESGNVPQPEAAAITETVSADQPTAEEPIAVLEEVDGKTKNEQAETEEVVKEQLPPEEQQSPQPQEQPAAEPVVALLLEEEEDETIPALYELETSILMHIFGFLDALDILNTAQINIAMYSTVDSIFGLGGAPDTTAAYSDNSTIATNEDQSSVTAASTSNTVPAAASTATTAATSISSSSAAKPAATTATTTSTTSASAIARPASTTQQQQPQETIVAIPPLPPATSTAAAASAGKSSSAAATAAAATERGGAFFGFLQTARKPTASSTSSTAIASTSSTATPTKTSSAASAAGLAPANRSPHRRQGSYEPAGTRNAPPMNAAMANSMAAKLSDSELNAIILMTERLKQNENLAERLKQENEKLRASLDGTEAVKQFLINKVREMEESLTAQENNETKVAQQIASDQEVIAFLDARIQTLERESVVVQEARAAAEAEVARIQEQTSKKASVLQDILQFEREKCAEQEREWRATKKLLVKEVKNCRAQIAKLAAERDGYREQNESLLRFGGSSSASSGGGGGGGGGIMSNGRDRSFT